MKLVIYFGSLSALWAMAFAAPQLNRHQGTILQNYGQCMTKDHIVLTPGTHQDPRSCKSHICEENGHLTTYSCGPRSVSMPGCTSEPIEVPGEEYPGCCKVKLHCPHNPSFNGKIM